MLQHFHPCPREGNDDVKAISYDLSRLFQSTFPRGERRGITSKISVYSSEIEVKKAIEMIAEQMATGKTTVIRVPTAEEVRTRLKNTRLLTEHHATGKKTKGHGGS